MIGGAGFIGSHTVDALVERGAKVAIVGRSTAQEYKKTGKYIHPRAKFYHADGASAADMMKVFKKERPDFVMNFAALTDIPLAIREPLRDAESILIIVNVLENAVRFGVKKILHASSGFIYGNTKRIPTPETKPPQLTNPYVISKTACENYLEFFYSQYGLPFVALRYANVYGPRRLTGSISYFIREIAGGRPVEIYGKKTRDCVFVSDVVKANLLAIEKNSKGVKPIFNIGSGRETDFIELHSVIAKILEKPAEPHLLPGRPGEVDRMCLDVSKAKRILGFTPRVGLKEGLTRTTGWYLAEGAKNKK